MESPSPQLKPFADALIQRYREAGGKEPSAGLDPADGVTLVVGKYRVKLANFLEEYTHASTDERSSLLDRIVRAVSDTGGNLSGEDLKKQLKIAVRERVFVEFTNLRGQVEMDAEPGFAEGLTRPFLPHLVKLLTLDLNGTIRYVHQEDLDIMNLTADEAYERALNNTADTMDVSSSGELYFLHNSNCFAASTLLKPGFFKNFEIKGRPLVLPVNREILLITGTENEEEFHKFITVAKDFLKQPRAMAPHFLVLNTANEWITWVPPKNCVIAAEVQELVMAGTLTVYAEQKQLLDKLHEKQGLDILVSPAVVKDYAGATRSVTLWLNGPKMWLAKTELIDFLDPEISAQEPVSVAKWSVAFSRLEWAMTLVPDVYPERYEVEIFPRPELLGDIHMPE